MNKKISLGLAISLIAIASAVTFILTSFFSLQSFNSMVKDVNEKAKKYGSLQTLDGFVREHYYGDIDEDNLSDGILKGYVSGLGDKYSRYLTPEEYQDEISSESGKLVGLGLTLTQDESGYIRIVEIMADSPVSDAGVHAGDIITSVEGNDVLIEGFDASIDALMGQEGTSITLTIRRDGIDKDYVFTRRSMEVKSVEGEMLKGYIGYIKITSFKQNTSEQFISELEKLRSNGAKGFVFDVRDNPGGLVTSLEECVDPLLPEGVIATAEYLDGHSDTLVYSDESEIDLPMVVIVNKKTASAGELFAASLKDFGKAQLVGTQTYGKGVMQETSRFDDGSAVVLTVAKYKTAKSECYDGIGITPDVIIDDDAETEADEQLDKAIETVKLAIAGE